MPDVLQIKSQSFSSVELFIKNWQLSIQHMLAVKSEQKTKRGLFRRKTQNSITFLFDGIFIRNKKQHVSIIYIYLNLQLLQIWLQCHIKIFMYLIYIKKTRRPLIQKPEMWNLENPVPVKFANFKQLSMCQE